MILRWRGAGNSGQACPALLAPLVLIGLAACAAPAPPRPITGADPDAGLAAIGRKTCGACHAIPGVHWPGGRVGGSLDGFANRAMIAGRFPNQPDVLIRWLKDPPAMAPGTAMPSSGLTDSEARDIAAYLYTLDDR